MKQQKETVCFGRDHDVAQFRLHFSTSAAAAAINRLMLNTEIKKYSSAKLTRRGEREKENNTMYLCMY